MRKNLLFAFLFLLLALGAPAAAQVHVTLPDTAIGSDVDLIVPIIVDTLDPYNVISLDFKLVYDSNLLTAVDTLMTNTLVKQLMYKQPNLGIPDTVLFAGFGIYPLTGGDTLIKFLFHSTLNSGICPLTFDRFQFNEGDPAAIITDGEVRVNLAPIPVELAAFSAERQSGKVFLTWKTLSEKNNYGFFVQRAILQNENLNETYRWQELTFIPGHGTSSEPHDYQFTDDVENLSNCFAAYRLKQIDVAGSFKFSPTRKIHLLPLRFSVDQNFPNPFNSATRLKFTTPNAGEVSISVFNMSGQKVAKLADNKEMEAGNHELLLDMSELSAGIYFCEITFIGDQVFRAMKKMIYLK